MKTKKFKVYCHRCKKDVELIQKMGGLICKKCSTVLYYHSQSMRVIPESVIPSNLELGRKQK